MSLFDMMDKFGKMADELQKNGNLAETMQQLPARLQAWTDFQAKIAADVNYIGHGFMRLEAMVSDALGYHTSHDAKLDRIISYVAPPGDLTPELAAETIANSANDPRNSPSPITNDWSEENAAGHAAE